MPASLFNPEVAMGIILKIMSHGPMTVQLINIAKLLVEFSGPDNLEGIQESTESIDASFKKDSEGVVQ